MEIRELVKEIIQDEELQKWFTTYLEKKLISYRSDIFPSYNIEDEFTPENDKKTTNLNNWDDAPDIMKIPQVASLLQLGLNQMYEIAKTEDFPGIYFGKQIRVHKEKLRQWINEKNN